MLSRLFNRCLLCPDDLKPSRPNLEVIGVFNPGAITYQDGVMLLVRVAERPREQRKGYTGLPRWSANSNELVIDWVSNHLARPLPFFCQLPNRFSDVIIERG